MYVYIRGTGTICSQNDYATPGERYAITHTVPKEFDGYQATSSCANRAKTTLTCGYRRAHFAQQRRQSVYWSPLPSMPRPPLLLLALPSSGRMKPLPMPPTNNNRPTPLLLLSHVVVVVVVVVLVAVVEVCYITPVETYFSRARDSTAFRFFMVCCTASTQKKNGRLENYTKSPGQTLAIYSQTRNKCIKCALAGALGAARRETQTLLRRSHYEKHARLPHKRKKTAHALRNSVGIETTAIRRGKEILAEQLNK